MTQQRTLRLTRLALLVSTLGILFLAALPATAQLDIDDPEDAIQAMRKLQCSTVDGKPTYYWWYGNVYSRIPGERDRLLFQYHGMNVRACVTVEDAERGTGYRMVSRELLFYADPETGKILDTWENPWTGETVDVIHVANDPVNSRGASFPNGPRGPYEFDATIQGSKGWMTFEVPLFYENPLGGDYQQYVGGTYQAIEMFSFYFDSEDLLSAETTELDDAQVGWARMSQWLPWMEMGSRVGQMMFHGAGRRVSTFEEMPDVLTDEIQKNYPLYQQPPALDDDRPNETSWTYFKKKLDERE